MVESKRETIKEKSVYYSIPTRLCPLSVKEVVKNSGGTRSVDRTLYWDVQDLSIASYNRETGVALAVKIPENSFALNFLPPESALLSTSASKRVTYERNNVPFVPFSRVLVERFQERKPIERLGFKDLPALEIKRAIKDYTKGRIKTSSLSSMDIIPFCQMDVYADRIELRTSMQTALLVIPYRQIRIYHKGYKEIKDAFYKLNDVGL